MREIGRHVRQFGQKLTPENINNFGQKALHMGRVMGRKMSNSISKIATMAGYTELGALASVGNGVKRLVQMRENIDSARKMLNDQ